MDKGKSVMVDSGEGTSQKKIKSDTMLSMCNGQDLVVEPVVANQMETISNFFEDTDEDSIDLVRTFPLKDITSATMAKVIEFYRKQVELKDRPDKLKTWEPQLAKSNKSMHHELFMATDYLNVSTLYKMTCQAVADKLSKMNMNMNQVEEYLKIANDYTQGRSVLLKMNMLGLSIRGYGHHI